MRLAVTGISGTIGLALGTLAEREPCVDSLVGVSSHPFDVRAHGWRKAMHVRADVRDRRALREALAGADAVVHLAFALHGVRMGRETLRAINVGGALNAFIAARDGGAGRFVQASSAVVYGMGDHPVPITEDEPMRTDRRHFYAQDKVRAERTLQAERAAAGGPELTILRPCLVAGAHAATTPGRAWPAAVRRAAKTAFGSGLRPPVVAPPVPVQALHPADAAGAFLRAALDGPAGTFNVAPDDVLDGDDFVHALGFPVAPAPAPLRRLAANALASAPVVLPLWGWTSVLRTTYVLDTTAAREQLGWRPRRSSWDALADTRAAWSA